MHRSKSSLAQRTIRTISGWTITRFPPRPSPIFESASIVKKSGALHDSKKSQSAPDRVLRASYPVSGGGSAISISRKGRDWFVNGDDRCRPDKCVRQASPCRREGFVVRGRRAKNIVAADRAADTATNGIGLRIEHRVLPWRNGGIADVVFSADVDSL